MSSSDAMQCSPEVDSNAESVVAKALTSVDKDIDDIETVAENSRVLLMTRDQSFTLHRARRGSDVRVGRVRVLCDPIIGVPYGSVFRVVMGELKRVHTSYLDEDTQHKDLSFAPSADNSELLDTSTNQRMDEQTITEMKAKFSGEELIEALKKHSKTFASKSEFSQEKWLRKKRKQHIIEVRVIKPTAMHLSRSYSLKKPDKTLYMRPDTLALILSKASVRPYSQVLILDQTVGLVTAAFAERMGGYGRIMSGFFGPSGPNAECANSLNLEGHVRDSIVFFPVHLLNRAKKLMPETSHSDETSSLMASRLDVPLVGRKGDIVPKDTIVRWLSEKSDALVLTCRADVDSCVFSLLPLLASGGSLVVYCPFIEPLNEVAVKLRSSNEVVYVQVAENFYREYQVLPNRTHPINNMSGCGGFILSAIKCTPAKPADASGKV